MLEYHANIAPVRRNTGIIIIAEENAAIIRALEPRQQHQDGGLSRSGRPQQRQKFARRNLHIQPVDCGEAAIFLGDAFNADTQV
ncbi:hypothetical protein C032_03163 [Brucella abortus 63/294]|nr:hypothetical protein C032_03163 [Brucella abortus 63/294]ENS08683.1 hypothetical protein C980_03183 [Brucella abortus 88/217]ERU07949.1 hypothetical protein P039_01170 [Brucella abortus 07-0994-2411]